MPSSAKPTLTLSLRLVNIYAASFCSTSSLTNLKQKRYELADGTVQLHAIKECPKTTQITYIVRRGWPFLPVFNNIIQRFNEAGSNLHILLILCILRNLFLFSRASCEVVSNGRACDYIPGEA